MPKLRVGMAQMPVVFGDVQTNLKTMERYLQKAQGQADLVLFPECSDLGWANLQAPALCHEIPGETSAAYCRLAQKYQLWVAAGITERCGEKVYNAALLLSSQGEIVLHHRKINVLTGVEDVYEIGDRLGVADTPFGRVGLNICADNARSSTVLGEALGRMGADFLLSPSAWAVPPQRDLAREVYGDEWREPYAFLSGRYGMAVVGVSNVGVLANGPWAGWKAIGNSMAYSGSGELVKELACGEAAEDFCVVELEAIPHRRKGTALAKYLVYGEE